MKHKKMITGLLLTIAIIAVVATIVLNLPQFGKLPSGERLERIKQSPQWKDGKFVNESPTTTMTGDKNMLEAMWGFLMEKHPNTMPDTPVPAVKTDLNKLDREKDLVVWFGHSSYLLQLGGKRILVDPVFYAAAPFDFASKAFKGSDLYKPEDMPEIDYLVITHNHYDHLDYKTVKELRPKVKNVVCSLGVGENFEYWDYDPNIITEMDWWEKSSFADGLTFNCTPARHFSGRKLFDNAKTLWASYVLQKDLTNRRQTERHDARINGRGAKEEDKVNIFIGGDSGYDQHFKKIGDKFGHIDLAFMENGQYNKDWNQIHTLPEQLAEEAKALRVGRIFSVHNGKFALAYHTWDEPQRNMEQLRKEGFNVIDARIGEIIQY